jgi:serine/threonine protein kinase
MVITKRDTEKWANPDSVPLIGTLFDGKYRIEESLGKGGMGIVYRAVHVFMDRPVAIKFLKRDRLNNTDAIERFKREARAAGRIQHQHATAVLDFGMADKTLYLVMEYLEGRTLRERLSIDKSIPLEEAFRIISQVCEAVEAAHRCNVIHRDLKPDNIFLQLKDGIETVKVLDFGIAKIMQDDSSTTNLTAESFMGTPHYMSPEQCQANPLDPTSDIYSLGVILFEMLAGRPPFLGETALSIGLKHLRDTPPDLCRFCPELPKAVNRVIARALSKDPQKRQQSALLFAEELGRAGPVNSSSAITRTFSDCPSPDIALPASLIPTMIYDKHQVSYSPDDETESLLPAFNIPDIALFCYEVESKLAAIKNGGTHYQVLELERDTTAEMIEAAYRRLSRRFAIIRQAELSAYGLDMRAQLEQIQESLREAAEVLGSPYKKQRYDEQLGRQLRRITGQYQSVPKAMPKQKGNLRGILTRLRLNG